MVTKPMMDLIPEQRMETNLNPQMVFQDETLQQFSATPQRSDRKVTNFITEKMFSVEGDRFFAPELGRNVYRNWNGEGGSTEDGSEGEEEDEEDEEEDEEDDEVDEGDGEVEGLVVGEDGGNNNNNKNSNSSGSVQSNTEKLRNEKANLQKCNSSVGLSRGVLAKDGNGVYSANNVRGSSSEQHHQQARVTHYENAVTIAEPDMYYSQFLQGQDTSALGQKEIGGENGCGFSGGKDVSMSMESGESLRAILSDPITGALMDDAMILPCGHSFGSGGMQHVIRTKSCCTCSQSVSEDLVAPNLSLRYAIQAFRREEELSYRASKRRRERFEQDKSSSGDLSVYLSRGKGVQFPFAVTDRVIIKGNKRTPLRFVGREAVVTTQCLNGWYVVKTLDNAESVKLQYRSLAKVSDSSSSNLISKSTPNWL